MVVWIFSRVVFVTSLNLTKYILRRYNSSWSLTHDAITGPDYIGTRFRIALKIGDHAHIKVTSLISLTLKFLVQNFVILLANRILTLTQQWFADFGNLERDFRFWVKFVPFRWDWTMLQRFLEDNSFLKLQSKLQLKDPYLRDVFLKIRKWSLLILN